MLIIVGLNEANYVDTLVSFLSDFALKTLLHFLSRELSS